MRRGKEEDPDDDDDEDIDDLEVIFKRPPTTANDDRRGAWQINGALDDRKPHPSSRGLSTRLE
eukprot:3238292-Lingulodinium_polyedra.AAC.1